MSTAATSLETAELMFGCFKRLRRLLDTELGSCGLSFSRAKLLTELANNGAQNQSSLASTFGLAPRTVTELLDGLERDGLVERHPDPVDRRARLVRITPAGEASRVRAASVKALVVDRVLGALDAEQLAGLSVALRLIDTEIGRLEADGSSCSPHRNSPATSPTLPA